MKIPSLAPASLLLALGLASASAQEAPAPAAPTAPAAAEEPAMAALKHQNAQLAAERERLTSENAIAKERLTSELAARRAVLERATLKAEEDKLQLANEFEEARIQADRAMAALRLENEKLTLESAIAKTKAEMRLSELRLQETESRTEITRLATRIEQREKELAAAQYAESKPAYPLNPLEGKTLVVSDRRISLNGPIMTATADEVSDRIAYFNNKSPELPIFIVIDNSPGGSVMAGYKILKSMQGSEAPVCVVVKSFAASMAACIATLADQSYAYPNAVILHHQISSATFGNLTQQKESIQETEEWWQRLAGPIAAKMGISAEDFIKKMYAKASTGDWSEFADKAWQLKWVDHIVDEIRETGQVKHPDLAAKPAPAVVAPRSAGAGDAVAYLAEVLDDKGRPCMYLPRPNPKDVYYLYNPDGYYRLP